MSHSLPPPPPPLLREPHGSDEWQRQPRRGAVEARQSADHQRGERGDRGEPRRENRGGAVPRELALQVAQHQEEEEVPHTVLPEEKQKERENRGLRANRGSQEEPKEERKAAVTPFCL